MMSEKKKTRFLKKIVMYSVAMLTVITITTLAICARAGEIASGTVTALCGAWGLELGLNAFIKKGEANEKDDGGASI